MHDVDFGGLTLSMSHFTTCMGMNVHATKNPATVTKQPVWEAVNDRGLFTGWFGVREKHCSG